MYLDKKTILNKLPRIFDEFYDLASEIFYYDNKILYDKFSNNELELVTEVISYVEKCFDSEFNNGNIEEYIEIKCRIEAKKELVGRYILQLDVEDGEILDQFIV